ncbi:hypothetical protein LSAT2_018592 [Lamellibrachia satsuma]|nr:hypothetical protein LSAT2_018592 [Lamellibrachia satsuma]
MNGASCIVVDHSYTCTCVEGYTGINCETDIDDCASAPCVNGGTCFDQIDAFSCTCLQDLYTGTTCETVVRYNYYQYGQVQGDVTLKHNVGFNCERNGKSCSSDFINVPKIQIFNGQYKRLRVRV